MLARQLRRWRPQRGGVLRWTAGPVVALTVIAIAVAVPHARRAGAADSFVTVSPQGVIERNSSNNFTVTYATGPTPAHITFDVNPGADAQTRETDSAGSDSYTYQLSSTMFDCGAVNSLRVDVDYHGVQPARSQTITGLAAMCPTFTVGPDQTAGTGRLPLTFTDWNGGGSFDSLGSYTDPAGAKTLFIDGVKVNDFGYQVAPEAALNATCGSHVIKLTQPSPYGTLTATQSVNVWCSPRSVRPQGLVSPTGPHNIAVVDATTTYPAGTTLTVGPTDDPFGTVTMTQAGHLDATVSDGGYYTCGDQAGPTTVHVHIEEPESQPPIHFRQSATALAPTVIDEDIPFYVACPRVELSAPEIDRSALPYAAEKVVGSGFDGASDQLTNKNIQPATVSIDGTPLGTATRSETNVDRKYTQETLTATVNPSCGPHTVSVSQPSALGTVEAHATLTVLCPQFTVAPAVVKQSARATPIALSGNTFHATTDQVRQPYVVTVDSQQVATGDMDGAGAFTNSFDAKGLACGPHTVTLTEQPPQSQGGGGFRAPARVVAAAPDPGDPGDPVDPDGPMTVSGQLAVTCPPPPGGVVDPHDPHLHLHLGVVPTPNTTLAVNPQGVIAGLRTFVTGTGYRPRRTVTLTWALPNGRREAACPGTTVQAGSDGTFAVYCLVPQHDQLGRRALVGSDGVSAAVAGVLIISSTMQPSSRHDRLVIRR